jgi:hypothetical protein
MSIGLTILFIVGVVAIIIFLTLKFLIHSLREKGQEFFCKDCAYYFKEQNRLPRCKNHPSCNSEAAFKVTGEKYDGDFCDCCFIRQIRDDCGYEPSESFIKG